MKNIYLTSTFTNPWNVEFNKMIGNLLEQKGLTCYLPHRDTDQDGEKDEIFNQDLAGIDNSFVILAIALNESPNWGAEIGYAYVKSKTIIALTDNEHQIPLICNHMIDETMRVEDLDNISTYIDELVQKIKDKS